jgi:hypothetical protein
MPSKPTGTWRFWRTCPRCCQRASPVAALTSPSSDVNRLCRLMSPRGAGGVDSTLIRLIYRRLLRTDPFLKETSMTGNRSHKSLNVRYLE